MEVIFRSIERWPLEPTPAECRRSPWTFKASWSNTLDLLFKELEHLNVTTMVIEVDVESSQIRQDGMLYANASPRLPGVIISFDSKYGPLRYPCDSCEVWRHNVRSIALALQALRAVDRYGVTGRAEQYRGWTKLAEPTEIIEFKSKAAAIEFVCDLLDIEPKDWKRVPAANRIRRALTLAHPDSGRGGTSRQFKLVTAAKELVLG